MRAFIGVPLPTHEPVLGLLDALRGCGADLKVANPHQFHLTLKFLGDVDERIARLLAKALRDATLPPPFEITIRDVGAFPGWKRPRVLWAGIDDPSGGLTQLHVACERGWVALGQPSEGREFTAHLTLARTRSDRGMDAAKDTLNRYRGSFFGTARIDRAQLYRSTLTPQGSQYAVEEVVAL